LFLLFFSLKSFSSFFSKTICFEIGTKSIDGAIYKVNEDKPFSGRNLCRYSNGKIKSKGFFRNGMRDDLWTEWNENKQISYERKYDQNRIVKLKKYENGKLVNVTDYSYYDKGGALAEWQNQELRHGQRECVTNYDGNNNKVGVETCWYINGQKKYELSYKNNMPSGMHTYWYEDGEIWSETFY
jgi:antitoxin component YwqK of YwqJK toxin-antitoxin module